MANEKRLVCIDEVETELRAYADRKHACGQTELANGILKAVNHLQTISTAKDAVEVVHGHKVVRERNRGIAYAMECPICNSRFPNNRPYTEKVEYCSVCGKKLDDTFQNYCPNCGAKMDGERREGE